MVNIQTAVLPQPIGIESVSPAAPARSIPPPPWLMGQVRSGGIAIGAVMVAMCGAVVWWGNGRFTMVSQASDNALFHRAGLFLIHTLALIFALASMAVMAISASATGKKRAVALVTIGLTGMILCVVLRHLVINFFLPWYELKRLVVFIPPALLWILNQHEAAPAQARKFGLLRALAAGMAVAIAVPALIIRAEGLLNTWLMPHLFATSYRGLIGLRILLIASLVASVAIAAIGFIAIADEWIDGVKHVRRWINWCFVTLVVAVFVGVAARTIFFHDRQLDYLLTRWIFTAFWLLLALGGVEWAGVWLHETAPQQPVNMNTGGLLRDE